MWATETEIEAVPLSLEIMDILTRATFYSFGPMHGTHFIASGQPKRAILPLALGARSIHKDLSRLSSGTVPLSGEYFRPQVASLSVCLSDKISLNAANDGISLGFNPANFIVADATKLLV